MFGLLGLALTDRTLPWDRNALVARRGQVSGGCRGLLEFVIERTDRRRQRIPSCDDVVFCFQLRLMRETIPVGASSSAG